jgi:hypothetical protein
MIIVVMVRDNAVGGFSEFFINAFDIEIGFYVNLCPAK